MHKSNGVVYICHHVDTEGPLSEDINALFERLKLIFNINLKPTEENLRKLQTGQIKFKQSSERELMQAIDPHTISFKENWDDIKIMLLHIMSTAYRNQMLDSFGGGWIFNWHIMDHVGFVANPRHRDLGYMNIYNFYEDIITTTQSSMDTIQWHFHPIPFYRQAHIPATSYDNSMSEIHQIIARRLIEKNWFPIVNRAGFHTERVDSNLFLEQWIPFDPSNQAIDDDNQPKFQNDLTNGRFGDWRGAPTDWSMYNPCFYDWRKKGKCNRTIARVLNMKSRHRSITKEEIEKAFKKAKNGENVYLGITNHDWREMSTEIDEFQKILKSIAIKYPQVKFKFSETIAAFRSILGYTDNEINLNRINFDTVLKENTLLVKITNGELFGPQPYLALKTTSGDYFHDNFDFDKSKKNYSYTFDEYTLPLKLIATIAVASNDKYGCCHICIIEQKNDKIIYKTISY